MITPIPARDGARAVPPRVSRSRAVVRALAVTALAVALLAGCARRNPPAPRACAWVVGAEEPAFDPDGPPQSIRWALEHYLTRGLVEEDSSGRIVPAAARSFELAPDSLSYTFHLRPGLRFTDGAAATSASFRLALEAGLGRSDHATRAWLLRAVRGVDRVRAGKPLPPLGIETPDDTTLIVRLIAPDPLLPAKLALPGVSAPWSARGAISWAVVAGLGPYRVASADSTRRLRLVRADSQLPWSPLPIEADTILVRFTPGAARVRNLLRASAADLVWPLPPGLLSESLPPGYLGQTQDARPTRRLLLVMRTDLPPTTRLGTRHALAHGLNRGELIGELGFAGRELNDWLPGGGPYEFPALDGGEVRQWMAEAKLGRSFHVTMSYDADGVAAGIARTLQGQWSRLAIYVELAPLKGAALSHELLQGRSHLALVDAQALVDDPSADVAILTSPIRGPAVGAFRTGWRTRELDPWAEDPPRHDPVDPQWAQRKLADEMVVLPLAGLPWTWVERQDQRSGFHPRFGPRCAPAAARGASRHR
jgi:ABC-type transport system substrate-binding protein